ncbi:redoxin domain-containing protein [Sphingobacterium oryzagri]|uniref:Redoxin domain-containing protein n=1 Tax=Sphingobacterium oryzagri TaxID=3025669 RepID=A0ABY7WBA9_9SPHI|nr:redoxin domain-containing protein [Sphingobacterium sp. KACC 22765]WDF66934.1 redoxin domain-containing protein [Sphingobacterium sp. KACC 22765]
MSAQTLPVSNEVEGRLDISPITAGEYIPDEIWELSFERISYGGKSDFIKLSDYKGKTIVIDFWATTCVGCIANMPFMHDLIEGLQDDVVMLPITFEGRDRIVKFLSVTRSQTIQDLGNRFFSLVDGKVMDRLIPHRFIPHVAIINKQGILEQSIPPQLLSKTILSNIAKGEPYQIERYIGQLDTTMLADNVVGLAQNRPKLYSAVSSYIDGYEMSSKAYLDSAQGIQYQRHVNRSILALMEFALGNQGFRAAAPNRLIMLSADSVNLDFWQTGLPLNEKLFSVSYEHSLPLDWPKSRVNARMHRDITDFTGYHFGVVTRQMRCLSIRRQSGAVLERSKEHGIRTLRVKEEELMSKMPRHMGRSSSGAKNYLLNAKMSSLLYYINEQTSTPMPLAFDETGIDYRFDIDLPDRQGDLPSLISALEKQGFQVVIEERPLKMMVVGDRPLDQYDLNGLELRLTKYGYIADTKGGAL